MSSTAVGEVGPFQRAVWSLPDTSTRKIRRSGRTCKKKKEKKKEKESSPLQKFPSAPKRKHSLLRDAYLFTIEGAALKRFDFSHHEMESEILVQSLGKRVATSIFSRCLLFRISPLSISFAPASSYCSQDNNPSRWTRYLQRTSSHSRSEHFCRFHSRVCIYVYNSSFTSCNSCFIFFFFNQTRAISILSTGSSELSLMLIKFLGFVIRASHPTVKLNVTEAGCRYPD